MATVCLRVKREILDLLVEGAPDSGRSQKECRRKHALALHALMRTATCCPGDNRMDQMRSSVLERLKPATVADANDRDLSAAIAPMALPIRGAILGSLPDKMADKWSDKYPMKLFNAY